MFAIAHYCLHKLKIRPVELLKMEGEELAFIIASIELRIEEEQKEMRR